MRENDPCGKERERFGGIDEEGGRSVCVSLVGEAEGLSCSAALCRLTVPLLPQALLCAHLRRLDANTSKQAATEVPQTTRSNKKMTWCVRHGKA